MRSQTVMQSSAIEALKKAKDALARAKTGGPEKFSASGPLHPFVAIGYAEPMIDHALWALAPLSDDLEVAP